MIRTRRLVTLLLGAWLGAGLPVDWILLRHPAPPPEYLEAWGIVQACFTVALFLVLLFGTHAGKTPLGLAGLLVFLTCVQALLIMPDIGRESPHMTAWYSAMEALEIVLALILAGIYLTNRGRKRHRSRSETAPADPLDQRAARP